MMYFTYIYHNLFIIIWCISIIFSKWSCSIALWRMPQCISSPILLVCMTNKTFQSKLSTLCCVPMKTMQDYKFLADISCWTSQFNEGNRTTFIAKSKDTNLRSLNWSPTGIHQFRYCEILVILWVAWRKYAFKNPICCLLYLNKVGYNTWKP